ncbi:MAG: hypothetical protein Phog2KO_44120 [Phototrophicaceae bacterium]
MFYKKIVYFSADGMDVIPLILRENVGLRPVSTASNHFYSISKSFRDPTIVKTGKSLEIICMREACLSPA